jgi:hypothetical protein
MSYAPYTAPNSSGYSEAAYPVNDYSPASSQGKFLELTPYKEFKVTPAGGVGPYHCNHFIGYFKPVAKLDPIKSTKVLFDNFAAAFNPGNEAIAEDFYFDGQRYVKFILAVPLGGHHQDWVSLQLSDDGHSFFAKTQLNLYVDPKDLREKLEYIALVKQLTKLAEEWYGPGPLTKLNYKELLLTNQRHFLAGRRSWSIGYNSVLDLHYIETPAFERYSHPLFLGLEEVLGLRESIVNIWVTLIENFSVESQLKLEVPPNKPRGYTSTDSNVFYRQSQDTSAAALQKLPWVAEVLRRHPGLLK